VQPDLRQLARLRERVAGLAGEPGFIRARELRRVGLPVAAMREWRYAFEPLDPESQRQAIHLAADWEWFDLAVATATRLEIFNDYPLLYPTPYADAVRAAEHTTALSADLIYAVMRQESLFRADAVSGAGARGLMQLQPSTAALALRHLGEATTGHLEFDDPAINIRLGATVLDNLLSRYQDSLPIALAAYNAGASAAERWLPHEPIASDIWIENIPFNETREYVGRVLWHSVVFRWLASGRAQSTRSWLIPIAR
jgi:soluble lytic murein transglycosylase